MVTAFSGTASNKKTVFIISCLLATLSLFGLLRSPASGSRQTSPFIGSITLKKHGVSNHSYDDSTEKESFAITAVNTSHYVDVFALELDDMHSSRHDHGEMPPTSIICQLSGELGNNLSKFGHAYAIWKLLKQNYPQYDYKIVLRHQLRPKWTNAKKDIDNCFPVLRKFDFSAGNSPEFDTRLAEQQTQGWMNDFNKINESPQAALRALANFSNIVSTLRQDTGESPISMPFLLSDSFVTSLSNFIEYADDYYDELRHVFKFNERSDVCCALRPDPDESVFHHRNFQAELPIRFESLGFEEMGPKQAANDLLGHLQPGDKVAILSRFNSTFVEPYMDAIKQRGLQVRFIEGQTGVQDFCFLMSAQKEIIGSSLSTFVFWAGILGNARKVRLYTLNTTYAMRHNLPIEYTWKNTELKSRYKLELYQLDDKG